MIKIPPRVWPFGRFNPKNFSANYDSVFGGISVGNIELTGTISYTSPQPSIFSGQLSMTDIQLTGNMTYTDPAPVGPLWSDVLVRADFDTNTNNLKDNTALLDPGIAFARNTTTRKWGAGSFGRVLPDNGTGFDTLSDPGPRWTYTTVNATDPITIEGWCYAQIGLNSYLSVEMRLNATGSSSISFSGFNDEGSGQSNLHVTGLLNGIDNQISGSATASLGDWFHFAFVRTANATRVYVNGSRTSEITSVGNTTTCDRLAFNGLTMNSYNDGSGSPISGVSFLLDDIRITKAEVYTGASITVPTGPFPTS
jgi:hypothetical protein